MLTRFSRPQAFVDIMDKLLTFRNEFNEGMDSLETSYKQLCGAYNYMPAQQIVLQGNDMDFSKISHAIKFYNYHDWACSHLLCEPIKIPIVEGMDSLETTYKQLGGGIQLHARSTDCPSG